MMAQKVGFAQCGLNTRLPWHAGQCLDGPVQVLCASASSDCGEVVAAFTAVNLQAPNDACKGTHGAARLVPGDRRTVDLSGHPSCLTNSSRHYSHSSPLGWPLHRTTFRRCLHILYFRGQGNVSGKTSTSGAPAKSAVLSEAAPARKAGERGHSSRFGSSSSAA
jgi:hypothetical protein